MTLFLNDYAIPFIQNWLLKNRGTLILNNEKKQKNIFQYPMNLFIISILFLFLNIYV